jgi:TetR/AcrR family transcriptional regulator, regulator of cefoperazone and chloramphenicol sensitivity
LFDILKQLFKSAPMAPREPRATPAAAAVEENTREKILEAAGEVFADQGFEGATVRAITERAGVNVAAVNYHFRDKAELYNRVVLDACSVSAAMQKTMAEAVGPPEARLRSLVYHFMQYLLDPARPDWMRKLKAREMANPTAALDELVEKNLRPLREEFLLPTLGELTGGCFSRKELSYIAASVMSQCLYFLQYQPIIERLNPDYYTPGKWNIEEIADHVTRFSLAALRELTRQARRS